MTQEKTTKDDVLNNGIDEMRWRYLTFRRNITKCRAALGLTARELSELAKLRQPKRISDIEDGRGQPTLEEVCAICIVLGQSIDEMLFREASISVVFHPSQKANQNPQQ